MTQHLTDYARHVEGCFTEGVVRPIAEVRFGLGEHIDYVQLTYRPHVKDYVVTIHVTSQNPVLGTRHTSREGLTREEAVRFYGEWSARLTASWMDPTWRG